ncbi:GNAT family N-acetyltransferase [Microbacterium sp. DT81.1]|uniref:GNAT family N-acetyltransferase n=1 Tax=Microbacterium sp. DT81.1 TaxID=3393413 RepID=UPI003CF9A834
MGSKDRSVRRATPADAPAAARLLHDFNTEFEAATPGVQVLSDRLHTLLSGAVTWVLLAGEPPVGIAVVTLRPNVWYEGPVALLDELYVVPELRSRGIGGALIERLLADATTDGVSAIEINVDEGDVDAQRFYERHGFSNTDPDSDERAFYYSRELLSTSVSAIFSTPPSSTNR